MGAKPIRCAAIDIGSNGIKMLVGEVDEHGTLRELDRLREPARLGREAFTTGFFTRITCDRVADVLQHFQQKMQEHAVERYRAVATDACRTARNGRELIQRIEQQTGVRVEIIDGTQEARLIVGAVARTMDLTRCNAALIELGGGSVEVAVVRRGLMTGCRTLDIGPIRMLERLRVEGRSEAETERLLRNARVQVKRWIEWELEGGRPDLWIGTGGGIESFGKVNAILCESAESEVIETANLDIMIESLLGMTVEQRMERLGLPRDRADICAIAAIVLRFLLKECCATRLHTSPAELRRGLLDRLAAQIQAECGTRAVP